VDELANRFRGVLFASTEMKVIYEDESLRSQIRHRFRVVNFDLNYRQFCFWAKAKMLDPNRRPVSWPLKSPPHTLFGESPDTRNARFLVKRAWKDLSGRPFLHSHPRARVGLVKRNGCRVSSEP